MSKQNQNKPGKNRKRRRLTGKEIEPIDPTKLDTTAEPEKNNDPTRIRPGANDPKKNDATRIPE